MVKLSTRFKDAWNVLTRNDYSSKSLPFAWPTMIGGSAQWHLIDIDAYIKQGFEMNSLIYSAIMYKVRAMMLAPLTVYTGTEEDPIKAPKTDELAMRIANPNENQTWVEFQSRNTVFLNLTGNVFNWFDFRTGEMHSLNPQRVYILTNTGQPAEIKGYLYVPQGKSHMNIEDCVPLAAKDVMHIKLPNPGDALEGLGYGLSPMQPAAHSVDVDNMVSKFLKIFFARGGMLTGVLSFDTIIKKDSDINDIKNRWEDHYGGFEKWSVGVLDRAGKYNRVGLTFEEMGFKEIDYRSETRVMGPFGVAPILIGARVGLDTATYANVEAARQAFWEDTALPEMMWHQVEYSNRFDIDGKFVEYDYSHIAALQRGLIRQVEAAHVMVEDGIPPNQAYRLAGVRVGNIPDGDKPRQQSLGMGAGRPGGVGAMEEQLPGQRDDGPDDA